jgi:hypothetical protein
VVGVGAVVLLLAAVIAGAPRALLAQDATPESGAYGAVNEDLSYGGPAGTAAPGSGILAHPAHIHLGTCATLDPRPLFPLSNVAVLSGTPLGAGAAVQPETSVTTVDAALADLVAGSHAINVHDRASNLRLYIACGNIAGIPLADGSLPIVLGEQNASGYRGVALLRPNPTNPARTDVTLFLTGGSASVATPVG